MSALSISTLDFRQVSEPNSREIFLQNLLTALGDVGVFYVKNTPVEESLFEAARSQCEAFFAQPEDEKRKIDIANVPSFLGYTTLGTEMTDNRFDWREHLTISDPHPTPTSGPPYLNLLAPNQWPSSDALPEFQPTFEKWLDQVSNLANTFRSLITEAMGIDLSLFNHFFQNQQHRLRLIKYPEPQGDAASRSTDMQSCGEHRDSGFSTLIFQASPHCCLQVKTSSGQWVDCPPMDNTFVFIAGKPLESLTHGMATAPWHRVITPGLGLGPRYSIGLNTGIGLDTNMASEETEAALGRLKCDLESRFPGAEDNNTADLLDRESSRETVGMKILMQYLKSHPDSAAKWYPQIQITA